VDIVYVAVPVVVYARLSVRLRLVGPELITYVFMVDVGAVVEYGNDDWLDHLAISPRERAGNVINPPKVAGAIRAVVSGSVVN
jgi:hypothetical protein